MKNTAVSLGENLVPLKFTHFTYTLDIEAC